MKYTITTDNPRKPCSVSMKPIDFIATCGSTTTLISHRPWSSTSTYERRRVGENDSLAEYRYHSGICMKLQAAVTSVVPRRPSAMTWRS